MENTDKTLSWGSVDSLWDTFEDDHKLLFAEQQASQLAENSQNDAWLAIDELWDSYAEQQQADLRKLRGLMAKLSDAWTDGASQFDADPLTTNWRPESEYEGPLRPNIDEEAWSQWLAHLLRTSAGPFVHALLGTPDRPPEKVRREVVFSDEEATRRIDILVEYESMTVSIEVKNGDTNYGKTPETAELIETDDTHGWSHILLLQNAKLPHLQKVFPENLDSSGEGNPTIRSEQYPNINIRYWQEISRLLRRMLLNEQESDSHWQASAYLFVTLIEQRMLKLHSFTFIAPEAATESDTAPTDLQQLVAVNPAAQIDYVRSALQEDYNHE